MMRSLSTSNRRTSPSTSGKPGMQISTAYAIGDRVTIDRDESIVGVITGVCVRGTGLNLTYDINWFHCGQHQSAWIEEWRVNRWDG